MDIEVIKKALVGVLVIAAGAASAQQTEPSGGTDGGSDDQGTFLRGSIEAGANFTDNAFYVTNDAEPQDASGLLLRPEVKVSRILPRFNLTASAAGELGTFDLPDDVDDYFDYQFGLNADWISAIRHNWSFGTKLREDHDPFGTERTEGTSLATRDLDQWRETNGSIGYRYGIPTDRYNLALSASALNRTYTTNRADTQFLDYEVGFAQIIGFFNLSPKSSLFSSISGSRTMYETVNPGSFDRSATEMRYGLGAQWKASAKTIGDLRLGYVDRSLRDSDERDFTSFDWSANLSWSPRSFTSFDLQTGRASQESYLNNVEFINNRFAGIGWTQEWTQLLQSRLGVRFLDSEFVGTSRTDQTVTATLDIKYRLTPYLSLLANASTSAVDSEADFDSSFAEYDRFYGYLGARYSR